MLREIYIKDLVFIDTLSLQFSDGFHIITGETGAGKSMLLSSLDIVLGARVKAPLLIRKGASKTVVAATFSCPHNPAFDTMLAQYGFEGLDELVLKRQIDARNRSKAWINGEPVTLGILKSFGDQLVDIHSQNQHQLFLQKKYHQIILDEMGNYRPELKNYQKVYTEFLALEQDYVKLIESGKERLRMIDHLAYQMEELDQAAPELGEDKILEKERNLLIHAQDISRNGQTISEILYEQEESVYSSLSSLQMVVGQLSDQLKEPSIEEDFANIIGMVENFSSDIQQKTRFVEHDPERLNEIEERLNLFYKLKRKYGSSIEEILDYYKEIQAKLDRLNQQEDNIENMKKQRIAIRKKLVEVGDILHDKRKKSAKFLAGKIENELKELCFEHIEFVIDVTKDKKPAKTGFDQIEFLISTNPDHTVHSLKDVASGGELSRIMLALKTVCAGIDMVPTMLFDEIDSGIGGRTAHQVAGSLMKLSQKRQIICISHLPQMAAKASTHFVVEKSLNGKQTHVNIRTLKSEEERLLELARLLGMKQQDESAIDLARKYLTENS